MQPVAIRETQLTLAALESAYRTEPPSEVAERVREYAFVLNSDPPELKTGERWWAEKTHKRRRSEGSDTAYDWLLPFAPLEVAKSARLQSAQDWGPHGAGTLAKELRRIVRERRKSGESLEALLKALYGVCVAGDLSASLKFEGSEPHFMAQFVNLNELRAVTVDFETMGYQCSGALSKTDVKWLIEAFGEPIEHQSSDALWPDIRRNAISRYCWAELRRSNASANSLGWQQKTI